MTIAATLGVDATKIWAGGGDLLVVEHDAAMDPKCPHATMDTAAIATATTLSCHNAITGEFGASGDLNIDIMAKSAAAEEKAFSALSTSDFTITALTTGRAAGCIVKLKSATDYAVTAWKNLGHLAAEGTEFKDSTPTEKTFNEKNSLVATRRGNRDIGFITGVLQTSRDMIDFLRDEAPSKYFALKYIVPVVGRGHQIYVAELVQIIPDFSMKFAASAERSIKIEIAVLKKTDTSTEVKIYEG